MKKPEFTSPDPIFSPWVGGLWKIGIINVNKEICSSLSGIHYNFLKLKNSKQILLIITATWVKKNRGNTGDLP